MAIKYACERCGGTAVTAEAQAAWNVTAQAWLVVNVSGRGVCENCRRKRRLFARPVPQ